MDIEDIRKIVSEMTPEEYENLTGQKKPVEAEKPIQTSEARDALRSSGPVQDDELAGCGGDSAQLHE